MIRFDAVSKRYRSVVALHDVSFEVHPGEIFGYIGPNGAGKTTSIKIMTGLLRDFTGSVAVGGVSIRADRQSVHASIGYLPQETGFQEWRTVEHVLSTFGRLSGLSGDNLAARINHVLAVVGIGEFRSRKVVHLSGGTVQKLRLAQALINDPKILILDEPLSGLDPASRYQVKNIIRSLAGADRVVFLSSHILSDVEDLASRIGILHQGTIRQIGTPNELREKYKLGVIIEVVARDSSSRDAIRLSDEAVERTEPIGKDILHIHLRPDTDLDAGFHSILSSLVSARLPLHSVRHLQPSLEDVYLQLTEASQ